jgi:hypothetical protein
MGGGFLIISLFMFSANICHVFSAPLNSENSSGEKSTESLEGSKTEADQFIPGHNNSVSIKSELFSSAESQTENHNLTETTVNAAKPHMTANPTSLSDILIGIDETMSVSAGYEAKTVVITPNKTGHEDVTVVITPNTTGYGDETVVITPKTTGYENDTVGITPNTTEYENETVVNTPNTTGYENETVVITLNTTGCENETIVITPNTTGYENETVGITPNKTGYEIKLLG